MKWRVTVRAESGGRLWVVDRNETRHFNGGKPLNADSYYTFLFEAEPPFRLATDREKFAARIEPADSL